MPGNWMKESVLCRIIYLDKNTLRNLWIMLPDYSAGFVNVFGNGSKTAKNYAGLDIGRADDYTVLTILNDKSQMIHVQRWRHDDWSRIIDKVAEVIKSFGAVTLVEVNNQGDVFYEMLQGKCRNLVHPFTTTSKTKPIIIEDLAMSFEQRSIQIIK